MVVVTNLLNRTVSCDSNNMMVRRLGRFVENVKRPMLANRGHRVEDMDREHWSEGKGQRQGAEGREQQAGGSRHETGG